MDVDRARALAQSLLRGVDTRWAHTEAVAERVLELGRVVDEPNRTALVAAAWLHDVGYAPELVDTGLHPLDGARFLAGRGVDELVVRLVAHHSGALVEAEERGLPELADEFETPPAELVDVLTCADMTTGPYGASVSVDERLAEILERYPADDPVAHAVRQSSPAIRRAVEDTNRRLTALTRQPM